MFFGTFLLAIGVFLVLNALGIATGIWKFFWGAFFVILGLKMIIERKGCWFCGMKGARNFHGLHSKFCDCECCKPDGEGDEHHSHHH